MGRAREEQQRRRQGPGHPKAAAGRSAARGGKWSRHSGYSFRPPESGRLVRREASGDLPAPSLLPGRRPRPDLHPTTPRAWLASVRSSTGPPLTRQRSRFAYPVTWRSTSLAGKASSATPLFGLAIPAVASRPVWLITSGPLLLALVVSGYSHRAYLKA